jgi:hypothetical protein
MGQGLRKIGNTEEGAQEIETDIAAATATPPHFGTSIFDAILSAQPYLNDRRLAAGQSS